MKTSQGSPVPLTPDIAATMPRLDALAGMIVDEYESIGAEIARLERARGRAHTDLLAKLGTALAGILADGTVVRRIPGVNGQPDGLLVDRPKGKPGDGQSSLWGDSP